MTGRWRKKPLIAWYSLHLIRHHPGNLCSKCSTTGNASAGICSFLRYQKPSTMRHKYKWNQLWQPWNYLLQKRKEMHFRGIISLAEFSQTDSGCWDYWAAFRHKPQSILWHVVWPHPPWRQQNTARLSHRGGESWLKNVYVGNKDLLLFLAHDSQMLLLEYHLSLSPQSTENMIWSIFAEVHRLWREIQILKMHLTANTAPFLTHK